MATAKLEKYTWTRALKIRHQGVREMLAEFMGTSMLVIFATGAGFQSKIGGSQFDTFLSVNFAVFVGVVLALFMCGGVSGGCFNPAVSLAMSLTGRLPWKRLPFHVIGQVCGGFCSAALVYAVYIEALNDFDGGHRQVVGPKGTADIFCSFPQDYLSTGGGFLDQVVGAGLLIITALSFIDPRNLAPANWMTPFFVGLTVLGIGLSYGMNCGYPINPGKDLGPRLFLLAAGWGTEVFSYRDYNWFWVPIVGPLTGAIVSCLIYWLMIELHHPEKAEISKMEMDIPEPVITNKITNGLNRESSTASLPGSTHQGIFNAGFVPDAETQQEATKF